ncbi:Protein E04D5.4 a [Aphelenchoides avenae]|nr:Protein E04D5.4 a [Aphelenchus avenae]
MAAQCAKTCNKCAAGALQTPADCIDAHSACTIWKNRGFCGNTYYTQDQKRQFCKKTCGLC